MLIPAKVKHRKQGRGDTRGKATSGNTIAFGSFGLQATSNGWVTARQIEASRRAMMHYIQRGGKVWIRIFPDKPITFKGNEVSLGGGKGAVDHYVAIVKKGRILFEMDGIKFNDAKEALRLASHKLPVRTNFVQRD